MENYKSSENIQSSYIYEIVFWRLKWHALFFFIERTFKKKYIVDVFLSFF